MDRMKDKLDSLWAEYREACPDPEPDPNFLPRLWQKIEARRASASPLLFRRWAEAFALAALAFSLVVTTFLLPRYHRRPVYQSTYVDVLADSFDYTSLLPGGDTR